MTDVKTIKRRDRYPITLTASEDLSTATVRWLYRHRFSTDEGQVLPCDVTGDTATHILDGTIPIGRYECELEATWPGDPPTIVTFPTDQHGNPQHVYFDVVEDID